MATKMIQKGLWLTVEHASQLLALATAARRSESAVMRLMIETAVVQPAVARVTVPMGGEERAI